MTQNEPANASTEKAQEPANTTFQAEAKHSHSRIGNAWLALIAFVLILLMLAIFILQNSQKVEIKYFGAKGSLAFGLGLLFAAIAGSLLTILVGSVRILQLRFANHQKSGHN
jgi:uncharacterized integral membrane protein